MVSVKEKEKWPFGKRIGHIRIGSQDLVSLLENCFADGQVSATTKSHEFSSLEDIKENLALFVGEIEVSIRIRDENAYTPPVYVKLGACATVGTASQSDAFELRVEKIARELKHYRIPILGYLPIIPVFIWVVMFFVLLGLLPSSGEPMPLLVSWLSEKFNAVLLLGSIVVSLSAIATAAFPPVYYNPKLTFWQTNRDKILLGVIMLIIGAALSPLIGWILEVASK